MVIHGTAPPDDINGHYAHGVDRVARSDVQTVTVVFCRLCTAFGDFTGFSMICIYLTIGESASGVTVKEGVKKNGVEDCTCCDSVTVVKKNQSRQQSHTWHFAIHTNNMSSR